MSREALLGTDDKNMLYKFATKGNELSDSQKKALWTTKIATGVILTISGIVGLIVSLVWEEQIGLELNVTTDYRTGAALDPDNFPNIEFTKFDPGFQVPVAASVVSIIAGLANFLAVGCHGAEMFQLANNMNPFIWGGFLAWHWLAFLVFATLAGVHNILQLTLIGAGVFAWCAFFWLADSEQRYGYQYARSQSNKQVSSVWSWIPVAFALIFAIIVYAVLIAHIVNTYGADAFDGPGIEQGWWLAIVLAHLGLYLITPVVFIIWRAGWISQIYTREMILYIFNAIFATATTWVTIGLLGADHVTLP